ncbi:MAG TPA: DNA-binding response regulator [candidate division Zixibacteria bacterium]|jgi:DNA-binding NarL/FixJ family response regulator|nr:DNA-binding response regulator [candidate division Zixibacteria bacterium]
MIRVLLADDHNIVRTGLKQLLHQEPDIRVADEADSGEEVMAKMSSRKFDVVVLDISMPGRGGLETLKQIRASFPKQPVLILSMHPEEQYAVRALRSGAMGYLTKSGVPDQLAAAIRKVAGGRKYITQQLAEQLAEAVGGGDEPRHQALSDRELEVMVMLARGRRIGQIAEALCLSPKTVSTYRSRIMDKMGMRSNAELARYAAEKGLD